jgi:hypothetical protein
MYVSHPNEKEANPLFLTMQDNSEIDRKNWDASPVLEGRLYV